MKFASPKQLNQQKKAEKLTWFGDTRAFVNSNRDQLASASTSSFKKHLFNDSEWTSCQSSPRYRGLRASAKTLVLARSCMQLDK